MRERFFNLSLPLQPVFPPLSPSSPDPPSSRSPHPITDSPMINPDISMITPFCVWDFLDRMIFYFCNFASFRLLQNCGATNFPSIMYFQIHNIKSRECFSYLLLPVKWEYIYMYIFFFFWASNLIKVFHVFELAFLFFLLFSLSDLVYNLNFLFESSSRREGRTALRPKEIWCNKPILVILNKNKVIFFLHHIASTKHKKVFLCLIIKQSRLLIIDLKV